MSKPIPKTVLMKALRERRKLAGLVKVECWVPRETKQRLGKYVTETLKGECNVKPLDK